MPVVSGIGPRSTKEEVTDELGDLGDNSVAERLESVHPSGNPISHSTHVGFSGPPTAFGSWSPFFPPPRSAYGFRFGYR
jgi:hypothetical protein